MKKLVLGSLVFFIFMSCNIEEGSNGGGSSSSVKLSMAFTRIASSGLDPFKVSVTVKKNNTGLSDQSLNIILPKGTKSTIIEEGNGVYSFQVTPSSTGEYPVTASVGGKSIKRTAIVLDSNLSGSGQPMAIPGDYVNTQGYEDGATVTADGQYLFVQYGPIYFSGLLYYSTICNSSSYSAGYDLNNCQGNTNSDLVFNTIGPYSSPKRPSFPTQNISAGTLLHLDDLVLDTYFNGIVGFPTQFYGFKRQSDGTYAEPFKLAFDDEKAINSPFGPSFILNDDGTANFLIAWNNYFDGNADGGTSTGEDDKPDIYYGSINLGEETSLGEVTYASNDGYSSITTNMTPVSFTSHSGVQGNPHAYKNDSDVIDSIWVDDEQSSHDLSVYTLTSGTFPSGTWQLNTLPSVISTSEEESQPFFTGDKLYLRRGTDIVYHTYNGSNGSCSNSFTHADCWGSEVVVIGANGNTGSEEIFSVGEPTIATIDNKKYLYFVYVLKRTNSEVSLNDWNLNVGLVELP